MANKVPKAFFAYPSNRPILMEAIRDAVRELNKSRQINIKTWEECNIGGKLIINTIYDEIDNAELFFADLTGLNPNVMFELGYAIARKKRIWLIFDTTYPKEKKMLDQLEILTTVGYIHFCNSRDIVSGFRNQNPVDDIEATLFHTEIEPNLKPSGYHRILYLQSQHEDQAAMRVSHSLQKKLLNKIIFDDPRESSVRSLAWYGSRVFGCKGLVCHFMAPEREGADLQTARHALVCGMAHSVKIPLLMLAEGNFIAPTDYRNYLKRYRTAPDALNHLDKWLPPVEEALKDKETAVSHSTEKLAADLRSLRFGDYVAENEAENLVDQYFIPTAAYDDALNGSHNVFVGRKGSGKTANLIKLEDVLGGDTQNVVCVIKPQRYQMLGIVDHLKQYQHRNVKAYTIESLWKFLLLTEIANTAYNNPPPDRSRDVEKHFFNFVEKNKDLICKDFSTRLETCIQSLDEAIGESNDENSYSPISEVLHSHTLKRLRSELGKYLSNDQRVAILVDNLDQAWERQNDIEALSEILWGLLEVAQELPMELGKQDNRRQSIQLSLAIFLRSDIFYRIRKVTREPDKMPYSLLTWDDPELLCRIIEERFLSSSERVLDSEVLWEQYFCPIVNGTPTREYITSAILKRPRDIIYLVNAAVTTAINRRHSEIKAEDILTAEKQYSQYVFESVNIENTLPDINLEDVLFEFVGLSIILPKSEVVEAIQLAGVPAERIEPTIDVLQDLTFLGLEIEEREFAFSYSPEESHKNRKLAWRFAAEKRKEERFQIHKAFRAFLETKEA